MLMDMSENISNILLDAQANLEKQKCISCNVKTRIEVLRGHKDNGLSHDECEVLVRRDGIRSEVIGECAAFDGEGQKVIEAFREIKKWKLQDKTIDLKLQHPSKKLAIAHLYFQKNSVPNKQEFYEDFYLDNFGSFLENRLEGHESSVIDLILESRNGFSCHGTEKIKDMPCYNFEAITDYGVLNAWVSPSYDFSVLKWRVIRDRSHLNCNRKPLSEFDWFRNEIQEFVCDGIEKIEGRFIVTSGELRTQRDFVSNQKTSNRLLAHRSQRSDIKVNPDFKALEAFKIDLPEGTILVAKGGDYDKYKFVNGSIEPFIDPLYIVDDDLNLTIKKQNTSR